MFRLALLTSRKVRESSGGLYLVSVLVLLGFITNRMNVSITGFETAAGAHYIPKWTELAVTGAIIAAGFALFGLAVKYLPIFPPEHAHDPSGAPESENVPVSAAPILGHAGD